MDNGKVTIIYNSKVISSNTLVLVLDIIDNIFYKLATKNDVINNFIPEISLFSK